MVVVIVIEGCILQRSHAAIDRGGHTFAASSRTAELFRVLIPLFTAHPSPVPAISSTKCCHGIEKSPAAAPRASRGRGC